MSASKPHLDYLASEFGLSLVSPQRKSDHDRPLFSQESIKSIADTLRLFTERQPKLTASSAAEMVAQGYRWLLGQEPESDQAILNHTRDAPPNWRKIRAAIMGSQEFAQKVVEISNPHLSGATAFRVQTANASQSTGPGEHDEPSETSANRSSD
jgi:hypothetical protein